MNQRTKTTRPKPARSQTYCVEVKREQTFWCYVEARTMKAAAAIQPNELLDCEFTPNRTCLRSVSRVANVSKV